MRYFSLPDTQMMPLLGLGTWKIPSQSVAAVVKRALQLGYRHLDCSPVYENESGVGQALQELSRSISRDDIWVTSKLWNDAHAAAAVAPALKKTLHDLRLDYLDLYLIHWPVHLRAGCMFPRSPQDFVPYEAISWAETWGALEECVTQGLVRHLGVSNFSAKKITEILAVAKVRPIVNQVESHPYLQQQSLCDFCAQHEICLTAYSPLGSLDRPRFLKKAAEPKLLENPLVQDFALKYASTPAQLLLGWAVCRQTAVIPKSGDPQRQKENLAAADLAISDEDMAQLARLDRGYRYIAGDLWAMPGSPYSLAELWDE